VYFEVSEAPYAASAGSFIGELLTRLGLGNAVPAELGPFPMLNPEFVVRAQPDIIMSTEREAAGMASRPGWETLLALRAGHTCGFAAADMDVLVRPGPRLGEAADAIVACLQRLPAAVVLGAGRK
jgi:iron complex transport system substrate-binding protein